MAACGHTTKLQNIDRATCIPRVPFPYPLDPKVIDAATRILNLHEAVKKVVKLYADRTRKHRENDERAVDLWILVVPEIIFDRCKPNARRTGLTLELGDFEKRKKIRSDLPLLKEILTEENVFDDAPDFHRQVKAEYLTLSPTQILRETTIAPDEFKKSGLPTSPHPRRRDSRLEFGDRTLLQDPTEAALEAFRHPCRCLLYRSCL
jgi:hypothetical protein